ncbi:MULTISPECIES: spore coat protein U domain-containing protein [Psychrobacter]|uniref:spore coat protein U domain-containing protein n=1 Tax=Psychrobacter TaxID=497 RepID=UPI00097EFF04|nr:MULTISPECIES: spore coat protein U domain-containing protein [Psychrobacter]SJN29943.1 Sigma-fimbriae tip adhesin [Psychrobacter sp. JB385]
MQFNKTLMTAALLTIGGFAAISANASGKKESEFTITTTITSVCEVNASAAAISFTDVAAGTLGTDIANKKSAGDISVKCSNDAPYVINLSSKGNSTSTTGEGLMTGTLGDTITYQLNSDADGTVWGNTGALGADAEGNGIAGTGKGVTTPLTHSVYATITGSTDVKQDTYTDTIVASVIY